jgi:hypothetical protein
MEHSRLNPRHDATPTSSSGTSTPNGGGSLLSASWTFPQPLSQAVGGLLRRFSSDPPHKDQASSNYSDSFASTSNKNEGIDGVYTPPYRTASPFQPPPLYPVNLEGYKDSTPESARLLTRALAEEIRLLVPPRLQLCEEWKLVYCLEEDGVSLGTLYKKCDELRGLRNGFVLVVRDGDGGVSILSSLRFRNSANTAIVVWCIFNRSSTSCTTLFRYWRMFSLARISNVSEFP